MSLPETVSREQWRAAREDLRCREEPVGPARGPRRRAWRLPMAEIDPECLFEGGDGRAALLDLFWTVRLLSLRDRVVTVCQVCVGCVSVGSLDEAFAPSGALTPSRTTLSGGARW
ncbi:DUF899 family protein [Streptomyces sp. KHY 26]|uniref:DUF899 family protein n=1 Tax=Streptomyces sp. KHY 26 TaxID=3097359 RepID=UPI00376EC5A9